MPDTSVSYKCPNCGAPLSFLPGHDHVTCEYCSTELEIATVEALFEREQEKARLAAEARDSRWNTENAGGEWDEQDAATMKVQTCSSCGAELVSDGNTMATECAYCGSPNMLPQQFSGMLRPDFVIPFKKTKDEAIAALKKFYEKRYLLPDSFKSNNRIKEIQAMYVPFWLFDSAIMASASFRAEKDNIYETADEIITETSVYDCERTGSMKFERIPVDGSERMDDTYMESIEPFDYSELVPFSAAYFTGFLAEKYDVDAEASAPRADKRVTESALGVLESTVEGYDRCSLDGEPCIIKEDGTVSYAMVPVWILTTKYEGKPYTFMMNGQTGKVIGSLPIDKRKATLYPLAASLISVPILYFIAKFILGSI